MTLRKKFEKFGLKYSDLPTMVWNVNIMMRTVSINVDSREKEPIPLFYYLVTASCTACYYYGYQFSMLWFVFWRSPQIGNLGAAMVYSSLGVSSQISTFKLFHMLIYGSRMRSLVDECLESNALSKPDTRFSRNMTEVLRIVKIRAIFVWLLVMVDSVLYVTGPAIMPGKHLPEDLLVFYGLEPTFETPNYEISYAIMFCCVMFICYLTATITVFVIIIIGYIEAQLTSLSKEILCLWDDSIQDIIEFKIDSLCALSENKVAIFNNSTKMKINKGVKRRLIQIVRNHSRNITLFKNINEFLNIPNAVAFGSVGISLLAELLGGLENTFLQIPFTFIQVAIDCFTGQKVMDASVAFERAVYSCKWENFDKDNMKIVLLMLQNSQKTLTLSAGRMAVLNFSCLMSIVRTVYSSYTALRSMI